MFFFLSFSLVLPHFSSVVSFCERVLGLMRAAELSRGTKEYHNNVNASKNWKKEDDAHRTHTYTSANMFDLHRLAFNVPQPNARAVRYLMVRLAESSIAPVIVDCRS